MVGVDKTSSDVRHGNHVEYFIFLTGRLCYSSHSTPLLLPHNIYVDVNGGSSVVYCIGESVCKS